MDDASTNVHLNSEDENISAHAEADWFEPLVGSNCSFVDRDRDVAAAVALGEVQNGLGQKLVNAAGEITEETQRAHSQNDTPRETEKQTYSNQLLHLAKLGLPPGYLPTQEALYERYGVAKEEKKMELQRSYFFIKNAITRYDEAMASCNATRTPRRTDSGILDARNKTSKHEEKTTAVKAERTRSSKKASRKLRQSTEHSAAKSLKIATKRDKRLGLLELFDHGPYPSVAVLEGAYVAKMKKLKGSDFKSEKKHQRARRRVSRAFRYLMKLREKNDRAMQPDMQEEIQS